MPDLSFLTAEDLVIIGSIAMGEAVTVRDFGLLDAAANRPRATLFGQDAYPTIHQKAAALLQSVVRNHALVDGNKRTGWLAVFVFYDINGLELDAPDDDEPTKLVLRVITDHLDIDEIATTLGAWVRPQ